MARKEKKFHFIYKTTNIKTGRYYYGMHSTCNLEDGYLGSGRRLRYSINKYGKENHKREIIEYCENRKTLCDREKEIVNLNEIAKKDCMNLMVGGSGGLSRNAKLFHSNGGKVSGKIHANRMKNDPTYANKVIERNTVSFNKMHLDGKIFDWTGKKHNDITKQKMSDKAKLRVGNKNSSFGSCWITNGNENRKIKKGDSIPKNWRLGRVLNKENKNRV